MYHTTPNEASYEANGFEEFFDAPSHDAHQTVFSEADFESIGLPYETWANDPEWQQLAAMGIGPIEAIQLAQPEYAETAPETLTEMLREQAWEMDSYDQAEFWKAIKRAARRVAKVAAKVVKPLAVKGGMAVGTFFGGPAGAAIGAKIGGKLGGLASRGLTSLSKPGGFKKAGKYIRRNINTAQTRVRRGQSVFNNQQVNGALSQLRALLSNPQISALLGRGESYGEAFGTEMSEAAIYDVIGGILEAAGSLSDALEAAEGYGDDYESGYIETAPNRSVPHIWAD
jgi:hypothetical protein